MKSLKHITVCNDYIREYLFISEFRESVYDYAKHNVQTNSCDNDEECDVIKEVKSSLLWRIHCKFLPGKYNNVRYNTVTMLVAIAIVYDRLVYCIIITVGAILKTFHSVFVLQG